MALEGTGDDGTFRVALESTGVGTVGTGGGAFGVVLEGTGVG